MKHLAEIIAAAETVRKVRVDPDIRRRECVHAMLECIRLARSWRDLSPERAGIAADLASAWAKDAIR